jgi:hypothetical protein
MMAVLAPLQALLDQGTALLAEYPLVSGWFSAVVRFVFPVLAVLVLLRAIRSLLKVPHAPEVWGQLSLPNGAPILLTHWENILGRGKTADVFLNYPSISRQHAALIRGEDERWTIYDLGSKGGTAGERPGGGGQRPGEAGGHHHPGRRAAAISAPDPGGEGGDGPPPPGGAARGHLALLFVADAVPGPDLPAAHRGGGEGGFTS